MEISTLEIIVVKNIAIATIELENIMRFYQKAMPHSTILCLIRGSFAGFCRDFLDAAERKDISILAKYWMLAADGANPVKDGASEEDVKAMEAFKKHLEEILVKEQIIWSDFDQI